MLIEVVIAEVRKNRETSVSITGSVADASTNPEVKGTLKGNTTGDFALEILKKRANLDLSLALNALASRGGGRSCMCRGSGARSRAAADAVGKKCCH